MSTPCSLARGAPLLALAAALAAEPAAAQVTTRVGTSATVAGLAPFRDQFRVDLGGGTTAGANGLFDDGVRQRREINWDGVPDAFSAPNALPANFFNVNSPRGVVFATPGSGFQVSSTAASGTPVNFGNIDPSYATTFAPFSPQRLFTPVGSNVTDIIFLAPGTNTPGATRGFGVVLSDVEAVNTTQILFFGADGHSLGTFSAAAQTGTTGFSFFGAFVNDGSDLITHVRIVTGNAALGAGVLDNGAANDVVVMDDFLYGNPVAIPEPGSVSLVAAGVLGWLGVRRRRVSS